jgi:pyruvate ferredoxin oxidoreductase beta subunit
VETGVYPLYEVENGVYRMTVEFPKLRPITDYVQGQGRFRHLTPDLIARIQERVTQEYEALIAKTKLGKIH